MAMSEKTKSVVDIEEVPTTTDDMERVWEWEYGDEIYGTFAKSRDGWKQYRRDMAKAKTQKREKDVYIDTFSSVREQLEYL